MKKRFIGLQRRRKNSKLVKYLARRRGGYKKEGIKGYIGNPGEF